MNNLVLSFSNLNIYLEFQKESLERVLKKNIIEQLLINYETLLSKKKKNIKIHYKIIFQDSAQIKQIKLQEKHFYSEFYSKTDSNTYKTYYHISPLQFQLLLHLILHDYAKKSSILMLHSSANLIKDTSALFIGKPGSGKTTIMKMLSEKYSPLADDSIIVDKNKSNYVSYQTPFVEKLKIIKNKESQLPLGGIYQLKKSSSYRIQKIKDKKFIFKLLLKNALVDDRKNINRIIKKVYNLAHTFDGFYCIEFGLNKKKLLALFDINNLISKS